MDRIVTLTERKAAEAARRPQAVDSLRAAPEGDRGGCGKRGAAGSPGAR